VADALKVAAAGGAATGNPVIAGGAVAVLVVYVAVDNTVGWPKVGEKTAEVFSGSGSGCAAGGIVCGPGETPNSPVQYQKDSSPNTDTPQGQENSSRRKSQAFTPIGQA